MDLGAVILVISGILHFLLSRWIDYLVTIQALGFESELPLNYVTKPQIYHTANRILGLAVVASTFISAMDIYIGLIVWIGIWIVSGKLGRDRAYEKYRQIIAEMIQHAGDDEDIKNLELEYKKSNQQLAATVDEKMKRGF